MSKYVHPECFGLWYEGGLVGPGGDDCRGCALGKECLDFLVEHTLPEAEAKITKNGGRLTHKALSKELGIEVSSVIFAQGEREHKQIAEQAKMIRPTIAGSAQDAADPAIRAWGKNVTPAGSAVERVRRVGVEWRPQYDEIRWRRERIRTAEIAALTPGMVLRTKYKGKNYECKVMKRGYVYDNHLYPTLYSVTKAIVGTREAPRQMRGKKRPKGFRNLSAYSAAKFWQLGRYTPKRIPKKRIKKSSDN